MIFKVMCMFFFFYQNELTAVYFPGIPDDYFNKMLKIKNTGTKKKTQNLLLITSLLRSQLAIATLVESPASSATVQAVSARA